MKYRNQQDWQERQRRDGNCRRCGNPAELNGQGKPQTYCAECRVKVNQRRRQIYVPAHTPPVAADSDPDPAPPAPPIAPSPWWRDLGRALAAMVRRHRSAA